MSKIAIVTDSTSFIPAEIIKKHNISVAPQVLIWGEETLRDGVDIQPTEFYQRLSSAKVMPTTSQVSPATVESVFKPLVDQGMDVVGIFISSKLSGTFQSALQAKEMLGSASEKVTLVDSFSTSAALGWIVLAAARAAEAGASVADVVALAEKTREQTGLFFAVDTLEFLHRGGRIGGAQRFIGSALNLKPILAIKEGKVEGVDRVRTKAKAHARVLELLAEQVAGKANIRVASIHANAADDAAKLLEAAKQQLNPVETLSFEMSPAVGTHAGPGTTGLAFCFGV